MSFIVKLLVIDPEWYSMRHFEILYYRWRENLIRQQYEASMIKMNCTYGYGLYKVLILICEYIPTKRKKMYHLNVQLCNDFHLRRNNVSTQMLWTKIPVLWKSKYQASTLKKPQFSCLPDIGSL